MESLVIPVLILAVVGAGVLLAARAIGRRRQLRPPGRKPRRPAPDPVELARLAAAKLTEEQHRRLYALIAQGQAMAAIKLYYESTGDGLRASRDAVGALAAHPQPFRAPEAADRQPVTTTTTPRSASRTATAPSPARATSPGRSAATCSTTRSTAGSARWRKSGDTEAAATALTRHSDISMKQAREFIALLDD